MCTTDFLFDTYIIIIISCSSPSTTVPVISFHLLNKLKLTNLKQALTPELLSQTAGTNPALA